MQKGSIIETLLSLTINIENYSQMILIALGPSLMMQRTVCGYPPLVLILHGPICYHLYTPNIRTLIF